jgi:hypothetical protein
MHSPSLREWNRDERRGAKHCAKKGHRIISPEAGGFLFCNCCGCRFCVKCQANVGLNWIDAQQHQCHKEATP